MAYAKCGTRSGQFSICYARAGRLFRVHMLTGPAAFPAPAASALISKSVAKFGEYETGRTFAGPAGWLCGEVLPRGFYVAFLRCPPIEQFRGREEQRSIVVATFGEIVDPAAPPAP